MVFYRLKNFIKKATAAIIPPNRNTMPIKPTIPVVSVELALKKRTPAITSINAPPKVISRVCPFLYIYLIDT